MSIYGVSFDMVGKQPIVLLRTLDGTAEIQRVVIARKLDRRAARL